MYRGREEAKQYHDNYGIKIPGYILAERIAGVTQMSTLYNGRRPFGSSIIIAAHDMMKGHTLWMVEPSGACFQYYGCAAGRGRQLARNEIEKGNFRNLTCQEALPKVAKLLQQHGHTLARMLFSARERSESEFRQLWNKVLKLARKERQPSRPTTWENVCAFLLEAPNA